MYETLKLWKLLTEGPNYTEPRSTNFNKAFAKTKVGLDNCIEKLASKIKYNVNNFDQWKKILKKNKPKNTKIKKKKKKKYTFYKAYTF